MYGRARWFNERLGFRTDGCSVTRLTTGLKIAGSLPGAEQRPEVATAAAEDRLAASDVEPRRYRTAFVLDGRGRRRAVRTDRKRRPAFGEIARPFTVRAVEGLSYAYVPLEADRVEGFDLETAALVHRDEAGIASIVEGSGYVAETGLVVGEITRPGRYQVLALPRNRWLVTTIHTWCLYWPWLEVATELAAPEEPNRPAPELIDRICSLILCDPGFADLAERGVFDRHGLPYPDEWPGGGDICERCVRDVLADDFVVHRGVLQMPAILKLCWWRRRCSKWRPLGPTPAAGFNGIGRVTQIDVHPTDGDRLIAGAAGGGVWRSTNGGATWRAVMHHEPTLTIGGVAIAPSNPSVVYAASGEDAGGWNPAWPGVGVYRSVDAGTTWALTSTLSSTRFSAIVVDPTDSSTLYVAGNTGLHKSVDGGATWLTNPGLASLFDGQVTDVVIAHDDPDRVYIGVRSSGVWRSTTAGEDLGGGAFELLDGPGQLPSGGAAGWTKLAIGRAGAHGSDFLAAKLGSSGSQIFSTIDGGTTWTELAAGIASVSFDEWCSVIAVDPSDEDILYAGGSTSLQRTMNGGATAADWTSIYSGVHADQQDIAFDPTDPAVVYLANDGGVYRSEDRGDNWTFRSNLMQITQFYDIEISELDRDVVVGGAQDNGIYYRQTNGVWRNISWGDGTGTAIDPSDPNIFYFSSQNGVPNWLRRSVDGGASHQALSQAGLSGGSPWVTIIKLDPTHPIADPLNDRVLFVCGSNQLFRSDSSGQGAWQRVEDGGGSPFVTDGVISALEFAASDPSILYLGTTTGAVYKATGGGQVAADWVRIDTMGSPADTLFPNAPIQAIRVHRTDPDLVWLVFTGAGVSFSNRPDLILNPLGISHLFKSEDGGANWVDASGQFPALALPDVPTSGVALHDLNRNVAYAALDVGVFRTADGGVTWDSYQEGLPRSPVTEVRFNGTSNRLFAATMGRGVYIRDV